MIHATCLYLTTGVVILTGQISPNDPGVTYSISNSTPNPVYTINPDMGDTNSDAAKFPLPPRRPKPVKFSVSPGTIRQGYDYRKLLKSTVVLSAPVPVNLLIHVANSDPERLTCSDIIVPKGSDTGEGTVKVNWLKVDKDCRASLRAYIPDNPSESIWFTVSIRLNSSIRLAVPTPAPGAPSH